jgi:hypothetical protein
MAKPSKARLIKRHAQKKTRTHFPHPLIAPAREFEVNPARNPTGRVSPLRFAHSVHRVALGRMMAMTATCRKQRSLIPPAQKLDPR